MENVKKIYEFLGNLILRALAAVLVIGFGILLGGITLHIVKFGLDGYKLWT